MFKKAILPLALMMASGAASAGVINGESELLTGSDHAQLSEWLGSDFDLTRIFAKGVDGYTGEEWHGAVDGRGATFTVLEAINDEGERLIIGGYNAQSWQSNGFWGTSKEPNSFLFSLSNDIKYEISDDPLNPNTGYYQTYNRASSGIYFSGYYGGVNLEVLGSELNTGYSKIGEAYGDYSRKNDPEYRKEFTGTSGVWFKVGAYETFALSSSTAPFASDVPVSFLLGGLGLLGIAAARRRS